VDGKPLITRIHVKYHIKVPKGKKAAAQRAVDHHEKNCAVSQSIRRGFAIEWEGEIEEE
jgi:organic hydroperoxide reductase OsmC/OhrA